MSTIDDLFSRVTLRERRIKARENRHEYRMAVLDGMETEDKAALMLIRAAIYSVAVVLLALIAGITVTSLVNTPLEERVSQICARELMARETLPKGQYNCGGRYEVEAE